MGICQAGAPGLGVLESVLASKVLGRLEGSRSTFFPGLHG